MVGDSVEAILRRIARENQDARLRFSGFAGRVSSAIVNSQFDELSEIVKEAGSDGDDDSKSSEPAGTTETQGQAGSPQ